MITPLSSVSPSVFVGEHPAPGGLTDHKGEQEPAWGPLVGLLLPPEFPGQQHACALRPASQQRFRTETGGKGPSRAQDSPVYSTASRSRGCLFCVFSPLQSCHAGMAVWACGWPGLHSSSALPIPGAAWELGWEIGACMLDALVLTPYQTHHPRAERGF